MKQGESSDFLKNITPKLVLSYLVRSSWMADVIAGIVFSAFFVHFSNFPTNELRSLFLLVALPAAVSWVLMLQLCDVFYADKYKTYVTTRMGVPVRDIYFLDTVNSDMSLSRRIAGYVYAVSRIVTFIGLGFSLNLSMLIIYEYEYE